MTTIILVAIGILLAAVAALFVVFYGGDAFDGGDAKARAATIENAGLNVLSASRAYTAATGETPAGMSVLTAKGDMGAWLASPPSLTGLAADGGVIESVNGTAYYLVREVVGEDVCLRINADYGRRSSTLPTSFAAHPHGCFKDGSGLTFFVRLGNGAAAAAPEPTVPRRTSDDDAAARAAYLQATARYVYQMAGRTVVPAMSLSAIGVAPDAFDYSGFGGTPDFLRWDGRTVYRVPVMSNRVCQEVDRLAGGSGAVDGFNGYAPAVRDEGCGGQYGQAYYWLRVDPAQVAGQVALMRANARIVVAAVSAKGYLPDNYSELGVSPDYKGIAHSPFLVEPRREDPFYQVTVDDEAICRALNAAGGGSSGKDVGGFANDGRPASRSFGCGGQYGAMFAWTRVSDAFRDAQVASIGNFTTAVSSVQASGTSPEAVAERQRVRDLYGSVEIMGDPVIIKFGLPERYAIRMTVRSEVTCKAIAGSYWLGRFDSRGFVPWDRGTGCGGNGDGNYYWWHTF